MPDEFSSVGGPPPPDPFRREDRALQEHIEALKMRASDGIGSVTLTLRIEATDPGGSPLCHEVMTLASPELIADVTAALARHSLTNLHRKKD